MNITYDLLHSPGNPRNSEGSFIRLNDKRIMLIYTRYRGNRGGDHSYADLVALFSSDNGRSWGDERMIVKNDAVNVMSVSLLRLQDGRIALAYIRKSLIPGCACSADVEVCDCRPLIRFSADEAESWSDPVDICGYPSSTYMVLNNDRLVQLSNGRLIVAVAHHHVCAKGAMAARAEGFFFLSDDGGATWRESKECCYGPQWLTSGLREPGVIELKDGTVMAWWRTNSRCHYKAFSQDGGESWSVPVPAPEFIGPEAPLSMKRDPETGVLYAVWNDWSPERSVAFKKGVWGRTPLVIAKSCDEGKSWTNHVVIESEPDHGYCYTAMLFLGKNELLLEYCCGGGGEGQIPLYDSRLRVLDLDRLNGETE